MIITNTFQGWEARLKPRSWGRFIIAAFLVLWLGGWAAGEAAAVGVIIGGVMGLMGNTSWIDFSKMSGVGTSAIIGFALLWLVLWTKGGMAALRELLRLIWGEDRLVVHSDGLRLERRCGPFVSTKAWPRSDLERIERKDRSSVVLAYVRPTSKPVQLTACADQEEADELVRSLRQKLGIVPQEAEPGEGQLPDGWMVQRAENGLSVLLKNPARRSRYAWILTGFALGFFALAATSLLQIVDIPAKIFFGFFAGLGAGLCARGAYRFHTGWEEWTLEPGQMQRRWRTRSGARVLSSGRQLVVVRVPDSDGDPSYRLELWSSEVTAINHKGRIPLLTTVADRSEPLRMGLWIAQQTGIAFEDRTTTEAERVQLEQMKEQLAASGRLGRWCAKFLPAHPR